MKKAAVVDQVTHAATHPISSAAYVFGLARGIGAAVIRAAGGAGESQAPRPADEQPSWGEAPAAAPQVPPQPRGEVFTTEPTAASRASGRSRGGGDAEVDDWRGDAELAIDPTGEPAADSVVEALERGDAPGGDQVDRAAMASVVSEATRARTS